MSALNLQIQLSEIEHAAELARKLHVYAEEGERYPGGISPVEFSALLGLIAAAARDASSQTFTLAGHLKDNKP